MDIFKVNCDYLQPFDEESDATQHASEEPIIYSRLFIIS